MDAARPPALTAAAALAGLATLGALLMAVAHLGVDLPLLPTVGAGRPVPPAAAAFALGTVLFALTTVGLLRAARWSWPLGTVAAALAFLGAAFPYRGIGSAVGMATSGLLLVLLLTPRVRRQLLSPAD